MRRETALVAGCLVLASITVLVSAVATTWAVADGASPAIRVPFRLICHGFAGRCFVIAKVPMPICARCTAIWGGLLVGAAAFPLVRVAVRQFPLGALLVAVLPLAIDGFTQALGLRESTNEIRALTGVVAGLAFALWALANIDREIRSEAEAP